MTPTIRTISSKKLIGKRITMSYTDNKTLELWKSFMPHRKEIINAVDASNMYSLQFYGKGFFSNFNPYAQFEKWAALEVSDFNAVPASMETLSISGGKYAVFYYVGSPKEGQKVFRNIFEEWLPSSGYELDDRAHFEILGPKYKNDDPQSEEEIWIPVR